MGTDQTFLQELSLAFSQYNIAAICKLLPALLEVKAKIVQRDPFEEGERAILNLGHTTAHALEVISISSQSPLRHGEAVAVGIVFELQLSVSLGYRTQSDHDFLLKILKISKCLIDKRTLETRLSTTLNSLQSQLCFHLQYDKKTKDPTKIPFVLLDSESWLVHVPVSKVCEVWEEFARGDW